jgi:hypothetical protein
MNNCPQECGDGNIAKVEQRLAWLRKSGKPLPMRNGKLCVEQFARDCGLKTRQPIYQNKGIRKLLAEFMGVEVESLDAIETRKEVDDLRSRLLRAEQQLAAVRAENDCLKEQVRDLTRANERVQAAEQVMLTGRRVIA